MGCPEIWRLSMNSTISIAILEIPHAKAQIDWNIDFHQNMVVPKKWGTRGSQVTMGFNTKMVIHHVDDEPGDDWVTLIFFWIHIE